MTYRMWIGGTIALAVFNVAVAPDDLRERIGDPPAGAVGSIFSAASGSSTTEMMVMNTVEEQDYDATPHLFMVRRPVAGATVMLPTGTGKVSIPGSGNGVSFVRGST